VTTGRVHCPRPVKTARGHGPRPVDTDSVYRTLVSRQHVFTWGRQRRSEVVWRFIFTNEPWRRIACAVFGDWFCRRRCDVQNGRQDGAVDWSISLKDAAAPSDVQQQQTASCNARFSTVTFLGCLPSRRSHYELHCSWHITEVTTRRGLSPLLNLIVRWRRLIHFSLMTRLYLARCDGRSTCRSGDFLTATDTSFSSRVK